MCYFVAKCRLSPEQEAEHYKNQWIEKHRHIFSSEEIDKEEAYKALIYSCNVHLNSVFMLEEGYPEFKKSTFSVSLLTREEYEKFMEVKE